MFHTQTEIVVPSSAHWKLTNPFIIKIKQVVHIVPTCNAATYCNLRLLDFMYQSSILFTLYKDDVDGIIFETNKISRITSAR